MGRILHGYLEAFHKMQTHGVKSTRALTSALKKMHTKYAEELEGLAFAAYAADEPELGRDFNEMLAKAERIARRYHATRGAEDYDNYKFLQIELKVTYPLTDTISTPAVIDLVTQDDNGIWLWEHKTGKEIPDSERRLKDLQTMVYVAILEEHLGYEIVGIVWNYLRTKEPVLPNVLKGGAGAGRVTIRKDIDTTWEVYRAAIVENGEDPDDEYYAEVRDRLQDREERVFFPRHRLPVLQSEEVLLRDFVVSAEEIETARALKEGYIPIRNVGYGCTWCPFEKVCRAAILGGDQDDVIARLFKRKGGV